MDIFLRLRFVFWVLVLGLWGLLFKQFCFDEPLEAPKVQQLQNPFRSSAASVPGIPKPPLQGPRTAPGGLIEPFLPPSVERMTKEEETRAKSQGSTESAPIDEERGDEGTHNNEPHLHAHKAPSEGSLGFVAPLPPKGYGPPAERAERKVNGGITPVEPPVSPRPSARVKTPSGFQVVETRHFIVYTQSAASDKFLATIENLHSNLMLDLAPFSPWAREEKVSLYLFDDQRDYRKHTGRPEWSGGASSLSRRAVYVYKSDEFMGILAHELCHIYFDTFFGQRPSPLWLSEGLATLVQSERGFAPPNWLAPNLEVLADGGGYHVPQLVRVNTTAGADDDSVRLWYAQSYSLVRFLIRMQRGPSFLHFCRDLREGRDVHDALLDAYGMPYNRLKALESAWRYDLTTHKLTKLTTQLSGLP